MSSNLLPKIQFCGVAVGLTSVRCTNCPSRRAAMCQVCCVNMWTCVLAAKFTHDFCFHPVAARCPTWWTKRGWRCWRPATTWSGLEVVSILHWPLNWIATFQLDSLPQFVGFSFVEIKHFITDEHFYKTTYISFSYSQYRSYLVIVSDSDVAEKKC